MTIIGGLDVHRAQITFDYVDTETGEVSRGRIAPVMRATFRAWLEARFQGRSDVELAVEGCTGWRFVVEEMRRAGIKPRLAEPAETAAKRGPKRRAKTDRMDAQLLRDLLIQDDLPDSWIPPTHVQEARMLAREYLVLSASRQASQQRIHAHLFHQGAPSIPDLLSRKGQAGLAAAELSPAARQVIDIESAELDALAELIAPLKAQLEGLGRRLPGPRALDKLWGIGPLTAVVIWSEIGDCRRFRRSDQVVRLAGLDVTVWSSDRKRSAGKLARQGAPALRWALYEAAMTASRTGSPDNAYYRSLAKRLKGKRAALSVARKLARRCYHTLREMGAEAMAETPVNASAPAA